MPRKSFKTASAQPPAPVQSGNGSVMGSLSDGWGLGIGVELARRAVDAIFGPSTIECEIVGSSEPVAAAAAVPAPNMNSDACGGQSKALSDCLSKYSSDISKCQFFMDKLQECSKSSGAALVA